MWLYLIKENIYQSFYSYYFDLECHIQIETDASGYVIGPILRRLNFDNFDQ